MNVWFNMASGGNKMTVYHGSSIEVKNPYVIHSRNNVDFGKGFYITPIKSQAEKWAERYKLKSGKGIVYAPYRENIDPYYNINLDKIKAECKVLEFEGYTEQWLDFIVKCRNGENSPYDVIIGGCCKR